MSNQNNQGKQKVNLWMDRSLVAQIDGVAARDGVSRAAVISAAVRSYLSQDTEPATKGDIAALATKGDLDGFATKSDLAALAAAVTKAIEAQPVQVVETRPELPDPEPDPDLWKSKGLIDRILKR